MLLSPNLASDLVWFRDPPYFQVSWGTRLHQTWLLIWARRPKRASCWALAAETAAVSWSVFYCEVGVGDDGGDGDDGGGDGDGDDGNGGGDVLTLM